MASITRVHAGPERTSEPPEPHVAARAVRDATAAPIILAVVFAAAMIAVGRSGGLARLGMAAVLLIGGGAIASSLRHEVAGLVSNYERALDQGTRRSQRAEGACRSRDALLRALGHELRASLNAILGWTALLQRCPDDPATVRRGTETIDRSARAQARLVDELESFPRARTPAAEPRFVRPTLDARRPRPPS
jgi:signal transduction histidine kinase